MIRRIFVGAFVTLLAAGAPAAGQSLRGSTASLDLQNRVAREHDFTYLETPADVRRFVSAGYLVPIPGNANYELAGVSYPYGRPEVRLFIERLSAQYRAACGEKLVVTSLTRPRSQQPPNASPRSVHPTGMAIDLRISQRSACRNWLERTLLSLEGAGVLDATRESNPPHYHVALFPRQYAAYVERLEGRGGSPVLASAAGGATGPAGAGVGASLAVASAEEEAPVGAATAVALDASGAPAGLSHRVARGETLWSIARRYGTTVEAIQRANGLASTRITAGQVLAIPAGSDAPGPSVAVTHRVVRGETLSSIARRYGTTVAELQRANGLTSTRIVAGQTLRIPAGGGGSGTALATYRVSPGDTLWTIARRHGTTIEELRRANGLGRTSTIYPGQVLLVPGS